MSYLLIEVDRGATLPLSSSFVPSKSIFLGPCQAAPEGRGPIQPLSKHYGRIRLVSCPGRSSICGASRVLQEESGVLRCHFQASLLLGRRYPRLNEKNEKNENGAMTTEGVKKGVAEWPAACDKVRRRKEDTNVER